MRRTCSECAGTGRASDSALTGGGGHRGRQGAYTPLWVRLGGIDRLKI